MNMNTEQKIKLNQIVWACAAVSKEYYRPVLAGLHVRFSDDQIVFESANGYSLHQATLTGINYHESLNHTQHIVECGDLIRVLSLKTARTITNITHIKNALEFSISTSRGQDRRVKCSHIYGQFPDTELIIPRETPQYSITVRRSDLIGLDEFVGAKFVLSPKNSKVHVTAGDYIFVAPCSDMCINKPVTFRIDVSLMLNAFFGEEQTWYFNNPHAPFVWKHENMLALLMPMR